MMAERRKKKGVHGIGRSFSSLSTAVYLHGGSAEELEGSRADMALVGYPGFNPSLSLLSHPNCSN